VIFGAGGHRVALRRQPHSPDLLAESGEQFVCQEFATKSRREIHAEVIARIVSFLQAHAVLDRGDAS
jgi:hypothetical protein